VRNRQGYVFKRKDREGWSARITFTDEVTGKRRNLVRSARTKAEAREIVERLTRELDASDGRSAEHERATFEQLADYYASHYVRQAEYRDGRKVAGLRSVDSTRSRLRILKEHFGKRRIRTITHGDLMAFRGERLAQRTVRGRDRTITTVNRELMVLRRMFNVAEREGWIVRNPFAKGDKLISQADERKRERILTAEEEARLLAACVHQKRQHLRPVLICALDTGMRRGEILKLRWSDVDLDARTITVRAFNTKTLTKRELAMTSRLGNELASLRAADPGADAEALVFGIADNVKRSFEAARADAGIPDLRFHDLRHTAATRLVQGHLALAEVGRILGHTSPVTTFRYVNADETTAQRAATILENFSARSDTDAVVN
jgi:integrase